MEIEKRPGEIGKKLWNIVRIVLYMMKKSIGKSGKVMVDLQMLLKRGKIATKAIGNLMAALHHHHHYYSALTCRSDDGNTSFISPRHYEFSCTNTPLFKYSKHKNRHHKGGGGGGAEEVRVMNKLLFDMLGRYDNAVETSSPLPGFGPSPVVRQLRVTDSPFGAAEESGGHGQVDMDAEEFIKKFYKDLKNQKRIAALGSPVAVPSPYVG